MRHAIPDRTAKSQRWTVAYDGRRYDVKFIGDKPREVQVRIKRRMGMDGWRMLWSGYGHRDMNHGVAEIIGFVQDPATAERAGAVVEDEARGSQQAVAGRHPRASSEPRAFAPARRPGCSASFSAALGHVDASRV